MFPRSFCTMTKQRKGRAKPREEQHPFPPIYNSTSRILIIGSFPSVKSREIGFYYGNPRNRFWPLMARLLGTDLPRTTEDRRNYALDHHFALFDVLASCEIAASSDASIRRAVPNDFDVIFANADIRKVFANGRAAADYFERGVGRPAEYLPSTSPANAAWSLDRLAEAWQVIVPYLEAGTCTPKHASAAQGST